MLQTCTFQNNLIWKIDLTFNLVYVLSYFNINLPFHFPSVSVKRTLREAEENVCTIF